MTPRARGRFEASANGPAEGSASAAVRRFLLAVAPDRGEPALAEDDVAHALRVLRLGPGDRLIGLDGRGRAWPLSVRRASRSGLELERDGEPQAEPRPGEPGALVPWIEVCVAWPRAGRAEAMLDRLAQLGASRIVPWTTERTAPRGELSESRRRRLDRVLGEACKQSGRLWIPELAPEIELAAELAAGLAVKRPAGGPAPTASVLLAPDAPGGLAEWAEVHAQRTDVQLRLAVGPEGGWSAAERESLAARGFRAARLSPYVLRIETAAEAAVAIVVAAAMRSAST